MVPDHRGEIWYDVNTGQPVSITKIGPVKNCVTTQPPSNSYRYTWDGKTWTISENDKARAHLDYVNNGLMQRRAQADTAIAPLQDAVDVDIATEQEKDLLKQWKTYRALLNRVSQQNGFPDKIDWPEMPKN